MGWRFFFRNLSVRVIDDVTEQPGYLAWDIYHKRPRLTKIAGTSQCLVGAAKCPTLKNTHFGNFLPRAPLLLSNFSKSAGLIHDGEDFVGEKCVAHVVLKS